MLLNVARIFATPATTFFACLALMTFFAFASSPKSSAAVGAATAGVSAGFAPSAAGASGAAAPFLAGLSCAGFAAASGFASFFGTVFFFSSAIQIFLVDAGLGVGVALHADRLARALDVYKRQPPGRLQSAFDR